MAESSWPSPSNSHVVADDKYEKLGLSYGATAGVVGDYTSPQLVYGDASGMQIKVVADRYALVRGHEWWSGSTLTTVPIASNASGSTRVDLVVLRLSRTTWDVNLTVIAGTPGSGAPAPVQNTGTTGSFDLPLATVTVASGASSVSAANVTYLATHLSAYGDVRVPSVAALSYVPLPTTGLTATVTDGSVYRYETSAWVYRPVASPYVVVEKTTGLPASIATGASWTSVQWSATRVMTDSGMWAIGNPTRLIAPIAGWYAVHSVLGWSADSSTASFISVIRNGTTERYRGNTMKTHVGSDTQDVHAELLMAAGDYVEVQTICAGAVGSLNQVDKAPWASLRHLRS